MKKVLKFVGWLALCAAIIVTAVAFPPVAGILGLFAVYLIVEPIWRRIKERTTRALDALDSIARDVAEMNHREKVMTAEAILDRASRRVEN